MPTTDQSVAEQISACQAIRKPYVLKFTAEWCGPCRTLHPPLQALCDQLGVALIPVDVNEHQTFAEDHGVRAIPHCVVHCYILGTETPVTHIVRGAGKDTVSVIRSHLIEAKTSRPESVEGDEAHALEKVDVSMMPRI